MRDKVITLTDIGLNYGQQPVLSNVSLTIFRGDFLVISGRNGGGKTSLLRILLGLQSASSGQVTYYNTQGEHIKRLNVGYLPQKTSIDHQFPISVKEVVVSGLNIQQRRFNKLNHEEKVRTQEVLESLRLTALQNRPIGQLSGGELQRTLLARTIVNRPDILVLDEPTSYMDKASETHFYEILRSLAPSTTIIIVTHHVCPFTEMATRIVEVDGIVTDIS